jgi:hypothetical protein
MTCLRCNGAGFLSLPAERYERGRCDVIKIAGRVAGRVYHGRRAVICPDCKGRYPDLTIADREVEQGALL